MYMDAAALPRTVEEIYRDYVARRAGIVKALTTDIEEFYHQCDPDKENLCLYGHPDGTWKVNLPAEEVPPELPEPALGINFPRDGLDRKDWLSLVSVHSDVWLLAVSSFYAARLDRTERKRLFNMINEVSTVFEVVSGRNSKQTAASKDKEKPSVSNASNKTKSSSGKPGKHSSRESTLMVAAPREEEEEEEDELDGGDWEEEEHGDTFCGTCDGPYTCDEFWIGCDVCENWYHGRCVKITPAKAEHIEQYTCPSCIGYHHKKPRPYHP